MAIMNFDYIKQMVNIIEDAQSVSFKDKLEIVIRGYRQLDDDEKEMFCSWLAEPKPKEKKECLIMSKDNKI